MIPQTNLTPGTAAHLNPVGTCNKNQEINQTKSYIDKDLADIEKQLCHNVGNFTQEEQIARLKEQLDDYIKAHQKADWGKLSEDNVYHKEILAELQKTNLDVTKELREVRDEVMQNYLNDTALETTLKQYYNQTVVS